MTNADLSTAQPPTTDHPQLDRVARVLDPSRHDHFGTQGDNIYAGQHLILDVVGGQGLDDEARIHQAFHDIVSACGATMVHIHTHKFSPQGVSGVAVLAESHISVHTWPEIGYGAFDVFMCGDTQPQNAIDVLKAAFETTDVRCRTVLRGEGVIGPNPTGAPLRAAPLPDRPKV